MVSLLQKKSIANVCHFDKIKRNQNEKIESRMFLNARQREIVSLAKTNRRVLVDDLAVRFAVSPQTIRKDLNDLCDGSVLRRVHGGAVIPSGTENLEYEQRRQVAAAEKTAIGKAAAALIPNGCSLFINIGTTTEAVGEGLLDHERLMIVTNNLNVANRLRTFNKFEVVVAGGAVRSSDGAVIGEAAVEFIRQFKVDYAVIGASAIDMDGSLLDFDLREVKVAQAIIDNARTVILVTDSLKLSNTAPVRIAEISQIDYVVTDSGISADFREMCEAKEVNVVEV